MSQINGGAQARGVQYNIALARLLRTMVQMVERGEIVAGCFVGISAAGVTTGGHTLIGGGHPGDYVLTGALGVEQAKINNAIASAQRPADLSPVIIPHPAA